MFNTRRSIGAAAMLLLLPAHVAAAQVTLGLSEAVEQARRQHPRIAAALAAEEAAANRTEQAGKWANPHVLVYQENFSGTATDIDQTIVSVTQRIRIGGQLGLAKASAQALREAAAADASMTVEQLGLAVQRAYADLYRVQESLRALEGARPTVDRLVADLDVRVREGDASRFDLLRMQLARDAIHADRTRLRAAQQAGWQRLAFLTGAAVPDAGWLLEDPAGTTYGPPALPGPPAPDAAASRPAPQDSTAPSAPGSRNAAPPSSGPLPGAAPPSFESRDAVLLSSGSLPENAAAALAQGVDDRFDAQAMAFRRQAAAARAAAIGREAIPDLVTTLGYTRLDPLSDGLVWSIGVDLPLFDRKAAAKAAELAEARRLDREYEALLAEASAETRAANAELAELSAALVELRRVGEPGELLPIATTAYEEGEITVTGLLDAARAQLDARLRELELEQARADAWFRWRYGSGQYVGGARQ
jgi:outer membrane protein TolC